MKRMKPRAPAGAVAGLLAAAMLLPWAWAATARAQEGAPPAAAPGAAAPAAEAPRSDDVDISARIPTKSEAARAWHLLFIYELHFNLLSDQYSANDVYQWYLLQAKFDLSKHDQMGVRFDMLQRFLADRGENGLFPNDLRVYYWRKFSIPIPKFPVPGVASIYLTLPTSRESRARSYLTRPTATLSLAPSYGPLTLILTGIYRYSFAQYAESGEGSAPNERQSAGIQAQLMWQPVDWFSPSFLWQSWWAEPYPDREGHSQGWRGSSYYFEVALNFTMPMPKAGPGLDLSLAYAQGAPMLAGGVYRFAFAKREQSELYLGLNLAY
jgi:hypothetical protein